MTEKRLFGTVKGYREHIVDNTGRLYSDGEVADLLNEQHETIQQLQDKDIIIAPQRHSKTATQDFLKRYTELLQYEDKVKETLQKHYNHFKKLGYQKYDIHDEKRLLKQIADELGVDLE